MENEYKNITVESIKVVAKGGAQINEAKRESLKLCIDERKTVFLRFNELIFEFDPVKILDSVDMPITQ